MRKLFSILTLLFLASPAWATWQQVQYVPKNNCLGTSQTCVLNVTAVGAGHTLVFAVWTVAADNTYVLASVSGENCGGTCSTYNAPNVTSGTVSILVVPVATGGETSFTLTLNASAPASNWSAVVFEAKTTGTPHFDSGNATSNAASKNPPGQTLTSSGNDLVLQFIKYTASGTISGVSPGGFAMIGTTGNSQKIAVMFNGSAATAATWAGSASLASSVAGVAFYDQGGSGGVAIVGPAAIVGPTKTQ